VTYPRVGAQPDLPQLEQRILERWKREGSFVASIEQREKDPDAREFVFYDGPPFANGLPHYGHLLTGYVKDAVPRYRTMRGDIVHRRFGWDCHGLPAEVTTEKELGISGHPEIIRFGLAEFNEACRRSVLQFTREWEEYVTRQARWVDFENDYKTLDLTYMESVMWAFKALWDRGFIYEGYKVLAYCWRCETPLSNTETRMDDVYHDRQDPAITVWFEDDHGDRLLAWTTTPWTLPSNLALAVGPDIAYAVVEKDGHRYVLADSRLDAYEREFGDAARLGTVMGADLVGRRYTPMFGYFADAANAFQVLAGNFVATDEGTGVVHMAPGFGEDDQIACDAVGIPTICPMDQHGQFTAAVDDWVGLHVFDANPAIITRLKSDGKVLRHDSYNHSYPHCWRCHQPLVYRAISSWFVKVTAFRDRMVELNQEITWVPEHVKQGSFGKWLANARDWSISRNRFWGSPIPVWVSDDPEYPRVDVYGSIADLEADFGVTVTDLHRPAVDELVRPNPDDPTGNSMMRRVPEVLDCWFDSGSMPFAQVHYPFENADWFETHSPGDFIVEYTPQIRGWFYTLHVLGTALFDRPAFLNCVVHGTLLGDDGRKMSKSFNNYPDPMPTFDTYGSDAVRWYLMASGVLRGNDFIVSESGIRDTVRQVILPLWNAWYFQTLYANAAGKEGTLRTDARNVLDRYVLAKTGALVDEVGEAMDRYDLFAATSAIRTFAETLTNWYIRRSRQRFWDGEQDAIDTLHTALDALMRVAAPLLPYVTEAIYEGLHRPADGRDTPSVHLADWPDAGAYPRDDDLVSAMDEVRDVCSSTLSIRKANQRRVRQPLAKLTVASPTAGRLADFVDVIAEEVNVRQVELSDDVAAVATPVLQVVPAALGPRLGGATQDVIKAVRSGDWTITDGVVVAGGHQLHDGEYTLAMAATGSGASADLDGGRGVLVLDIDVTPELEREGVARDLIRLVQQARRDAGLDVSDRIALSIRAGESWIDAIDAHRDLVAGETLATSLEAELGDVPEPEITVRAV
jgi:isoleucyl-tRNA synthetase